MLVLARNCSSNLVGFPAQGLIVDCANGVGAGKLQVLADRLAPGMAAELRNTSTEAGLNDACGADFLQKERRLPAGFQDVPAGARCAPISTVTFLPRLLTILLLFLLHTVPAKIGKVHLQTSCK